jgi:hypothetical protein
MRKVTIRLPEQLKARVERTARLRRQSQAAVIRSAIDCYVETTPPHTTRPQPRLPLFDSGDMEPIVDWDEALRGFGDS